MKYIKLVTIIILIPLFTGCWDYRELDHMSIVSLYGIDRINDEFLVSIQIVNTEKPAGGSTSSLASVSSPVVVYSAAGKSLHEASRKILDQLPKRAYIGQLQAVVIGESLAKDFETTKYIDFLLRYPESRKTYSIIIAKDSTANELMKVLTPLVKNPGEYIVNTIDENNMKLGIVAVTSFEDFIVGTYAPGIEITTPAVSIIGNIDNGKNVDTSKNVTPDAKLIITGTAVFNNNKLIGYLNQEESIGYTFIMNKFSRGVIAVPCDDKGNYASASILNSKTENKVNMINNKPAVDISVALNTNITEISCKLNIDKRSDIKKIEKMIGDEIKSKIETTLKVVKNDLKSDIFGYGLSVYRTNYPLWRTHESVWNDLFVNLEYNVKVNVTIKDFGSIFNSYKDGEEYVP